MGKTFYFIIFCLAAVAPTHRIWADEKLGSSGKTYSSDVRFYDQYGHLQTTTIEIKEKDRIKIMANINSDACKAQFGEGAVAAQKIQQFLNLIDYVGIDFAGDAICVNAFSDAQAGPLCGQHQNRRALNPLNPQYSDKNSEEVLASVAAAINLEGGKPTRDRNPYGFYLCVQTTGSYQNRKSQMCNRNAMLASSSWANKNNLDIRWDPTTDGDGNCMCRQAGNAASAWEICQPQLHYEDICTQNNLLADDRSPKPEGTYCKCPNTGTTPAHPTPSYVPAEDRGSVQRCQSLAAAERTPAPPAAPSADLVHCVETTLKNAGDLCKTEADAAQASCRVSGDSSDASLSNVPTAVSQALNNSLSGSGAKSTCFQTALAANAAQIALAKTKSNCGDGHADCTRDCSPERFSQLNAQCTAMAKRENPLDQQYLSAHASDISEIQTKFTDGARICSQEVPKSESTMSDMLTGLGNSMTSSMKCACQLSTTSGGTTCEAIPSANACVTNPDTEGCGIYSALNSCTLGATYNAALCACQSNPKGSSCPGGTSTGALSAFASGAAIKNQASNGVSGFTAGTSAAGGGSGGNFDLGSDPSGATLQAGANKGSPSNGLGSTSGGGSGSPGGGGSGGGDQASQAESSDKSLLKDVFGFVKNLPGKIFGSKDKANGDSGGNAKKNSAADMSKFRPTRGTASADVGSKNMDIWKMMNNCVQGATCRSNQNSFMVQP